MEEYYSTSPRRETKAETTLLIAASSSSSSTSFSYYNPCHYFEVAIWSFLKCLGLGRSSAKEQDQEEEVEVEVEVEVDGEEEKNNQSCTQDVDVDPPPTSADDETGKQKIEDVGVNNVVTRWMRRTKVRFPARPRIRPGRPGQINSTSPS